MKTLRVKIRKVKSAVEREGFGGASRKVVDGLKLWLRPVVAGDVLIITAGVGDSARYRAHHVAEELNLHGVRASVIVQDHPFLLKNIGKFKVFVFHRTLYTEKIKKAIDQIKEKNQTIIFDTDDLVYDPQYLPYMDYYKQIKGYEKKVYENGISAEIVNDPYVKTCTTTTTFLADKLRALDKSVFIVPNKLSQEDIETTEKLYAKIGTQEKNEEVRIGYFSGTISHNKDFATISDALITVMEKYDNVTLYIAGALDLDVRFDAFGDRVTRASFASRQDHFARVARCAINLAPLEYDNPYCEAKSELKFFEAGSVGVPTVAIANQTHREAIEDGTDGFLAGNTEEWIQKLSQLVEDAQLRARMGEKARQKVLEQYTTENATNDEYVEFLTKLIKNE